MYVINGMSVGYRMLSESGIVNGSIVADRMHTFIRSRPFIIVSAGHLMTHCKLTASSPAAGALGSQREMRTYIYRSTVQFKEKRRASERSCAI